MKKRIGKMMQFLHDCKEAMNRDNAGGILFIHLPTGADMLARDWVIP